MPYIDNEARDRIAHGASPSNEGELNYAITILCARYMAEHGGVSYQNINACVGVLECAKEELYRRIAAPYEDHKCAVHGDVYVGG